MEYGFSEVIVRGPQLWIMTIEMIVQWCPALLILREKKGEGKNDQVKFDLVY